MGISLSVGPEGWAQTKVAPVRTKHTARQTTTIVFLIFNSLFEISMQMGAHHPPSISVLDIPAVM